MYRPAIISRSCVATLAGYHSIRVNKQWRLVFRWDGSRGEARKASILTTIVTGKVNHAYDQAQAGYGRREYSSKSSCSLWG